METSLLQVYQNNERYLITPTGFTGAKITVYDPLWQDDDWSTAYDIAFSSIGSVAIEDTGIDWMTGTQFDEMISNLSNGNEYVIIPTYDNIDEAKMVIDLWDAFHLMDEYSSGNLLPWIEELNFRSGGQMYQLPSYIGEKSLKKIHDAIINSSPIKESNLANYQQELVHSIEYVNKRYASPSSIERIGWKRTIYNTRRCVTSFKNEVVEIVSPIVTINIDATNVPMQTKCKWEIANYGRSVPQPGDWQNNNEVIGTRSRTVCIYRSYADGKDAVKIQLSNIGSRTFKVQWSTPDTAIQPSSGMLGTLWTGSTTATLDIDVIIPYYLHERPELTCTIKIVDR